MQDAPGLSVLGGIDLAPKQEFADSVANPGQVDSEVLSAADQIAQLLLLGLRDADQAKLAGAQQTGQPDRITLVDLMWSVAFFRMWPGAQTTTSRPRSRALRTNP